jgi:hypothetical protein
MTTARLGPPPAGWQATRAALHDLAENVIAPARKEVDGRIRLKSLPEGFGTPVFGGDRQIRIEGAELVRVQGASVTRDPIAGADAAASDWLARFYAFVLEVLDDLRAEIGGEEPVLWPEHFDYAIVAGDEAAGSRANYGGSPGDEHHPDPYLYVGPWEAREGELWNATGFSGAELPLEELLAAEDQHAAALDFFRARARALEGQS